MAIGANGKLEIFSARLKQLAVISLLIALDNVRIDLEF